MGGRQWKDCKMPTLTSINFPSNNTSYSFDGATSFEYSDTEPIAGNYYPITSFGYIKDENAQFSVITDRAQGMVASDGVVEIMVVQE